MPDLHSPLTAESIGRYAIIREGRTIPLVSSQTRQRLFHGAPKPAVVIGTFAGVAYVHLQLEARRRFYPDVPLLVHDDCSPVRDHIAALCREYRADFETTAMRFPPCKGDIAAFIGGIYWAEELGANLLVKLSRRFVPMLRWVDGLLDLAMKSDYATYSSWTSTFNFGFRTECMAMAVNEWKSVSADLVSAIHAEGTPFVEGYMHNIARRLSAQNTMKAAAWDDEVGRRPADRNGYAPWPFMLTDRCQRSADFLWHDWAKPADYAELAARWSLDYSIKDFSDPNMGFGRVPTV